MKIRAPKGGDVRDILRRSGNDRSAEEAMSRINPQVEALEREVRLLRGQIAEMRRDPGDMPFKACGTSCAIANFGGGMSTNGGCQCGERELRRAARHWRRVAEFRQVTIQEMRARDCIVAVQDLLAQNGCDCDCEHSHHEHDDGCERCLACRIDTAIAPTGAP